MTTMVGRVFRPLALLLVFSGVVALVGAALANGTFFFTGLAWSGIVSFVVGWSIFVITRNR
jgi:hypothetical protein